MENGSVIRILDDCASYVIIADEAVAPTSELPSHLSVHNDLLSKNSPYKASVHTHPIELIAKMCIRDRGSHPRLSRQHRRCNKYHRAKLRECVPHPGSIL